MVAIDGAAISWWASPSDAHSLPEDGPAGPLGPAPGQRRKRRRGGLLSSAFRRAITSQRPGHPCRGGISILIRDK